MTDDKKPKLLENIPVVSNTGYKPPPAIEKSDEVLLDEKINRAYRLGKIINDIKAEDIIENEIIWKLRDEEIQESYAEETIFVNYIMEPNPFEEDED